MIFCSLWKWWRQKLNKELHQLKFLCIFIDISFNFVMSLYIGSMKPEMNFNYWTNCTSEQPEYSYLNTDDLASVYFAVYRLQYWNKWIQRVSRHVITQRFAHVTPFLRGRLHWLPCPKRIQIKVYVTTGYTDDTWLAPDYIKELCASAIVTERLAIRRSAESNTSLEHWTLGEFLILLLIRNKEWEVRVIPYSLFNKE